MDRSAAVEVRDVELPRDHDSVRRMGLADREIVRCRSSVGHMVVAYHREEPCGVGTLQPVGTDTAEITMLYVEPAARGMGAGNRLLERLLGAAKDAGYLRVTVDGCRRKTIAHRMLRGFGFIELAPHVEAEVADRHLPDRMVMQRDLRDFWLTEGGVSVSQ